MAKSQTLLFQVSLRPKKGHRTLSGPWNTSRSFWRNIRRFFCSPQSWHSPSLFILFSALATDKVSESPTAFGDSEVTLMRHRLTGSQGSWHWQLWMSNQLPIYWHVRKINLICLGHPKSNCLLLAAKIFLNDPSIARSLTICINPIVFIPIVFKSELSPSIIPAKTGLLRLLASANLIGENSVSYSFNLQGQRFIFFD